MTVSVSGILSSIFPVLNAIIPGVAGGKLSTYSTIAQTAIKSAVTTIDGGISNLQAAYDKFETSNPLVQMSVSEFVTLAKSLGVALPTEDAVITHLKAAVADLAGILVPVSDATSATATATTATTAS
ncbi:hypothetical protein [Acetobacter fallax]|uniref:Uncharacterized protein n=1 Tax=Acetobacter fallax TaxID=1737473 RepID=A0ABX0KC93_9PROT|nr:hypothetical protein [Acetobacter fallax]NHO33312.1 hypothetical protein [Acetobacter fallax]NHO36933.1 hypothetical protein [Acetobacter fallax]